MNTKKLQLLISAGVFSATLLSGAAYAEDTSASTSKVQVSTATKESTGAAGLKVKKTKKEKKEKTSDKSAAHHDCASSGGCASDK